MGFRLGKGEKLQEIIDTLGSVAEGVTTAKGLKEITDDLSVSAPIATAVSVFSLARVMCCTESVIKVYEVLYEGMWKFIPCNYGSADAKC